MVDARIYKIGIEVLAESPLRLGVTKQAIEVLGENQTNTTSTVRAYKLGMEILRETPDPIDLTKQSVEVLGQNQPNASSLNLYKIGIEVLRDSIWALQLTKQSVEVLGKNITNSSQVNIFKLGMEILFRSGPVLSAPAALPSYWEVFAHNWATEISMETGYETDVSRSSYNLTEERRSLRDRPYRILNLRWSALTRESVDRLSIFIRKITDSKFFVPLYQDIKEIYQLSPGGSGQTILYGNPAEARFFANQRIAVVRLGDDMLPTEVAIHEIDSVEADHLVTKSGLAEDYEPGLAVIFPCMDVELVLEPTITYRTDRTAEVTLQVPEVTASTALPPTWTGLPEDIQTYDDIPVFSWDPDWTSPVIVRHKREGQLSGQGRGIVPFVQGDRYRKVHQYLLGEERSPFWDYLKFFDSRRGRKKPFWHIDLENIWNISNLSGVFVEIFSYGDFTEFQEEFDYIGIVTTDGQYYVRKVITIQEILDVFRITVDLAFPAIDIANVVRVTRARLSRFMKDTLTERWRGNEYIRWPNSVIELLNEADVEMT